MDITVDRVVDSNRKLVFTISVENPEDIYHEENDLPMLKYLHACQREIEKISEDNQIPVEISQSFHELKSKLFYKWQRKLRFAINEDLHKKFMPICTEIYNWFYDQQSGLIRSFMEECDPQRTRYYFDNDRTIESDYAEED